MVHPSDHLSPREAVELDQILQPTVGMAMHSGTFALARVLECDQWQRTIAFAGEMVEGINDGRSDDGDGCFPDSGRRFG